jgi:GntR family transcriptional repressor for pyruvate dehydrogenase complex
LIVDDARQAIPADLGFAKVRRRRVFEEIVDQIRAKLASGEYKPGDKLPTERELAQELGVGRPALREALRTLENSGVLLLKKGPQGGAFVREGSSEAVTRSLHDLMHLGHLSMEALVEARVVITRSVVEIACARGTDADFEAIESNIDLTERLEAEGDFVQRVHAGTEYFRLVAVAAHNDVLMLLVDSLTAIVRFMILQSKPAADAQVPRRRALLAALRRRDRAEALAHLDGFFRGIARDMLPNDAAKRKPAAPPVDDLAATPT